MTFDDIGYLGTCMSSHHLHTHHHLQTMYLEVFPAKVAHHGININHDDLFHTRITQELSCSAPLTTYIYSAGMMCECGT